MNDLWTDPTWLAGAHAWVDEQTAALGLVRAGDVEQPHVETWSTVLRVPTTTGPVWFKANHGPLEHEAALVGLLAERAPEQVRPRRGVTCRAAQARRVSSTRKPLALARRVGG